MMNKLVDEKHRWFVFLRNLKFTLQRLRKKGNTDLFRVQSFLSSQREGQGIILNVI